ncbi:hypothetical protein A6A25_30795 [Saccharothrix sp. CB00851]|nr:hypothetical protein A6A25_30795 [Saccharothrix sp. CB00851]
MATVANVANVQARTEAQLTTEQQTRAALLVGDASAIIHARVPDLSDPPRATAPGAIATAVLRALASPPDGNKSETVGGQHNNLRACTDAFGFTGLVEHWGVPPPVVVVVVVVDVEVEDVVVETVPPVQVVPFNVNVAGTPTASPVMVPLKPNDAVPPVGIERFQSTLDAVTLAPEALNVAFQPWPKRSEPGKDHRNAQPSTGSPRLVIVTFPVNPPCHLFCTT